MVLEVMIDSPEGIKVEDCAIVSRALSEYMDEVDLIHRTYTLEVSSPGVERILKRVVDFERHIGKLVKWTLKIEDESEKKEVFRARLQEFTDGRIVVSLDKSLREFPIDRVVEARAILEFPPRLKQG
jgi:ribosome maturation factor RimP